MGKKVHCKVPHFLLICSHFHASFYQKCTILVHLFLLQDSFCLFFSTINNSAKKNTSILYIFILDQITLIKPAFLVINGILMRLPLSFTRARLGRYPLIPEFNSCYSQRGYSAVGNSWNMQINISFSLQYVLLQAAPNINTAWVSMLCLTALFYK